MGRRGRYAEPPPPLTDDQRELAGSYYPRALRQTHAFRRRSPWLRDDFESAAALGCMDAARLYSPDRGEWGPFARRHVLGRLCDVVKTHFRYRDLVPFSIHDPDGLEAVPGFFEPADHRRPGVAEVDGRDWIDWMLDAVTPRERHVIGRVVLDGLDHQEVAPDLGLTRSSVSRIWGRGIQRLREFHLDGLTSALKP